MLSLSTAWKVLRDLGPIWVLQRLNLVAQARFGILKKRLPVQQWQSESLGSDSSRSDSPKQKVLSRFFFSGGELPIPWRPNRICEQADRLLSGEWPFFFSQWLRIGFPPNWHFNALDRTCVAHNSHWSEIDLDAIHDVKFIWEPSRFSVAYLLARAYGESGDERYPDAFWKLVQGWAEQNPPHQGVNWASGQEVALRVMALCFGLHAFATSSSSTPVRISELIEMIEVHGNRIAGFVDYGLSQRNNHGIAEAVGLFAIGILLPEFRHADKWKQLGRRLIESQIREQVYEDGSYIQHSFNYQRVLIDHLIWSLRLGELHGEPFSEESYTILGRAAQFMLRFCDPKTGRMPNYGSNDGSLVLPLSSCDFLDYRPSLQAAHYMVHREFVFDKGEWDEQSEWLFGAESVRESENPHRRRRTEVQEIHSKSGYLKLIARESSAMLRAARYVDRPSQADQLHLDLWWRGENIACDAGTYLYNAPPPWTNALATSTVHNTISISNRDQMTRVGRFLWVDWAQASCLEYWLGDSQHVIEAWHDGYEKLGATHRRAVTCLSRQDCWLVIDDVYGSFHGPVRLHWLFANCEHEWVPWELRLILKTRAGQWECQIYSAHAKSTTLAIGDEVFPNLEPQVSQCDAQIRGWRSLYYGQKEPAVSLAVETNGGLPVRFVTVLAPSSVKLINLTETMAEVTSGNETYGIFLRPIGSERIFSGAKKLLSVV